MVMWDRGFSHGQKPISYLQRWEKRAFITYANSESSSEMLLAHVSGMPRGNFSQRTRHVASLVVKACALKDWFHGKSEELFSQDMAHLCIAPDKRGYLYNSFLISRQNIRILIRSASRRRFWWEPQLMFSSGNKKNNKYLVWSYAL